MAEVAQVEVGQVVGIGEAAVQDGAQPRSEPQACAPDRLRVRTRTRRHAEERGETLARVDAAGLLGRQGRQVGDACDQLEPLCPQLGVGTGVQLVDGAVRLGLPRRRQVVPERPQVQVRGGRRDLGQRLARGRLGRRRERLHETEQAQDQRAQQQRADEPQQLGAESVPSLSAHHASRTWRASRRIRSSGCPCARRSTRARSRGARGTAPRALAPARGS